MLPLQRDKQSVFGAVIENFASMLERAHLPSR